MLLETETSATKYYLNKTHRDNTFTCTQTSSNKVCTTKNWTKPTKI